MLFITSTIAFVFSQHTSSFYPSVARSTFNFLSEQVAKRNPQRTAPPPRLPPTSSIYGRKFGRPQRPTTTVTHTLFLLAAHLGKHAIPHNFKPLPEGWYILSPSCIRSSLSEAVMLPLSRSHVQYLTFLQEVAKITSHCPVSAPAQATFYPSNSIQEMAELHMQVLPEGYTQSETLSVSFALFSCNCTAHPKWSIFYVPPFHSNFAVNISMSPRPPTLHDCIDSAESIRPNEKPTQHVVGKRSMMHNFRFSKL